MSEPAPEGLAQEAAAGSPRRAFSILVTVVCSIVVAIYVGLPLGPLIRDPSSPLAKLERPEDSLERLVTRELDLREAMRRGLIWEWRLYRALMGGEDPVRQARTWYEELADTIDSTSAELRRTILQAEAGDLDRVEEAMARWKDGSESAERMASWVGAAYLGAPPGAEEGRALIALLRDELDRDWFADTLTRRIAARIGDASAQSRAESAIVARGRTLQLRLRVLMALVAALLVAGALVLAWMLARRSRVRVADAPLPPDWSMADGYALFVRGLGAPQAIIVVILFLVHREGPFETLLIMAASLPVFWWVAGYIRGRDRSIRAAFGLVPRRDAWPRLLGVTLVLIALALIGDALIDAGSGLVGLKSHWADGFSEDLLWHPRWAFVVDTLNATVWAPAIEEVTFRGLLYATLRTRLRVWPAAVLSAAIFALPHGYAAAGSLSVLVSGLLWALAYERTRSLLPGLLAHSANNVMSTLWVVGLLRM